MKVTTLRLPEGLYEDLADEAEARDRSFSEYVRMLLRNRQENTAEYANTQEHTQANTAEHAVEYADRLDGLEDRVAALEERAEFNQQQGPDGGELLVKDLPGAVDLDDNPHSQTVERAIQWARENQPVSRREIVTAFEDEIDGIKPESWWKRHARDGLKDAGAECSREGGVATWSFPD